MPTPTAPPNAPTPPRADYDATREFSDVLDDPKRWIVKKGVPVFKPHTRTDPNTQQQIKVDLPKLYRIAANMAKLEQSGVPIRMTLGHTEPGKPETQQPPLGGFYRNPRVATFGRNNEPAVVCDEYLDPAYAPVRKNYPYRSSEYYDDAEQITGVALLSRDPFLDLGVVAYGRGVSAPLRGPTLYRNGSIRPGWQFIQGDDSMPDPTPPNPPTAQNPHGVYTGPLVPGGQPPMQYGADGQPVPYGWSGGIGHSPMGHTPGRIGQSHPSGGAVYAAGSGGYRPQPAYRPRPTPGRYAGGPPRGYAPRGPGRYADDDDDEGGGPPPSMSGGDPSAGGPMGEPGGDMGMGGPPPGGPGGGMGGPPPGGMGGDPMGCDPMGGGDPLQTAYQCMQQATEAIGRLLGVAGGPPPATSPPAGPFPCDSMGGPGGPPPGGAPMGASAAGQQDGQYARYGTGYRPRPTPGRYAGYRPQPRPRYYSRDSQPPAPPMNPQQYGAQSPLRTITGRPVNYDLRVSQLQYQLQQSNEALRVLYYERDQADTEACVAEIQRLADQGYPVTDFEVHELKKRPREQRAEYLQHISTKYQKVPTEQLPPMMGDPTPGPVANQNRPATREEMEAALKLTAQNPQIDYATAIHYARSGQLPTGPVNRFANVPGFNGQPTGPAPEPFIDPFAAEANGHPG